MLVNDRKSQVIGNRTGLSKLDTFPRQYNLLRILEGHRNKSFGLQEK